MNSGLLFAKYACACKTAVLKEFFKSFFWFPNGTVKMKIQKQISQRWNPFSYISRSIANPKSGFKNLNPDFPIERTLTFRDKEDYENEIFLILGSARARTNVILGGKPGSRRHSTTSFGENVIRGSWRRWGEGGSDPISQCYFMKNPIPI